MDVDGDIGTASNSAASSHQAPVSSMTGDWRETPARGARFPGGHLSQRMLIGGVGADLHHTTSSDRSSRCARSSLRQFSRAILA